MNNSINPARLIVTSGEPAGIGPDLLIQLAHRQILRNVVIVADPDLLKTRARLIGVDCHIVEYSPGKNNPDINKSQLNVLPIPTNMSVKAGELNPENADYVLKLLNTACDHCLDGSFDALVTGPLSKSVINDAGIEFTGHTEYLAERCGKCTPVMLLPVRN